MEKKQYFEINESNFVILSNNICTKIRMYVGANETLIKTEIISRRYLYFIQQTEISKEKFQELFKFQLKAVQKKLF